MENKPVVLSTHRSLHLEAHTISEDSAGKVALVAQGNSKSTLFHLWIDHEFVKEIRGARAISFLDGWKLANQYSDESAKAKEYREKMQKLVTDSVK
jgi:hypothetical protein